MGGKEPHKSKWNILVTKSPLIQKSTDAPSDQEGKRTGQVCLGKLGWRLPEVRVGVTFKPPLPPWRPPGSSSGLSVSDPQLLLLRRAPVLCLVPGFHSHPSSSSQPRCKATMAHLPLGCAVSHTPAAAASVQALLAWTTWANSAWRRGQ